MIREKWLRRHKAQRHDIWELQQDVLLLLRLLEIAHANFCEAKELDGEQTQCWLNRAMRQPRKDALRILARLGKIDKELIELQRCRLEHEWERLAAGGMALETERAVANAKGCAWPGGSWRRRSRPAEDAPGPRHEGNGSGARCGQWLLRLLAE